MMELFTYLYIRYIIYLFLGLRWESISRIYNLSLQGLTEIIQIAQMRVSNESKNKKKKLKEHLVVWGCRIQQQHLYKEVRSPNEFPGYEIKPSDGKLQL